MHRDIPVLVTGIAGLDTILEGGLPKRGVLENDQQLITGGGLALPVDTDERPTR